MRDCSAVEVTFPFLRMVITSTRSTTSSSRWEM